MYEFQHSQNVTIDDLYTTHLLAKEMNLQNEVKELVGLDGYLVKDKTNTKAVIFNKGNSYEVTFSEEFAEEDIVKILNTFVFE